MMSFPFHKKSYRRFVTYRQVIWRLTANGADLAPATLRETALLFGGYSCRHLAWRQDLTAVSNGGYRACRQFKRRLEASFNKV
jgi:hypothetical protein